MTDWNKTLHKDHDKWTVNAGVKVFAKGFTEKKADIGFWKLGAGEAAKAKTIAKEDAETLAVAYHAFHDTFDKNEWKQAAFWGGMLIEAQEKTGTNLTGNAAYLVDFAKQMAAKDADDWKEIK